MAEDFGEKTEAPTQRRREEARERGQIARSPDLTAAVLLLAFLLLMQSLGPGLIRSLRQVMAELLSGKTFASLDPASMAEGAWHAVQVVAMSAAPFFIAVIVIAVVMNLVQIGFYFNPQRIQPNLGTLNPLRGLGQLFQSQNLIHQVFNVLKLLLVGAVAWSAVKGRLAEVVTIQQLASAQAFGLAAAIIYSIGLRVAIVLLVLAILDYAWQRYHHEQQLRMTRQEVKEEMRHMEGDPRLKQRRRQIAIQIATRQLRKDVPQADVVVTNPTHFAVALKYDKDTMSAPRVVAKGQDLMAQRIREIAVAAGVPIVERAPLARALYKLVPVGREIPEQFYSAVAEILAYVYELTGKLRRRAS